MYGYIYETKIKDTNQVYIGMKKSDHFVETYFGSGVEIKKLYKIYDITSFNVRLIDVAYSQEELRQLEISYIKSYKEKYGDRCINIHPGGSGGDVITPEKMIEFKKKMTAINRSRCGNPDFKKLCSKRLKKFYSNYENRKIQSIRIKKVWEKSELRKKQSEKLKNYYKNHPKDCSYLHKRCNFLLNGTEIEFDSIKELRRYLISEYDYNPDRRTFNKIIQNSEKGISYMPFHRNNKKLSKLRGMMIFRLDKV